MPMAALPEFHPAACERLGVSDPPSCALRQAPLGYTQTTSSWMGLASTVGVVVGGLVFGRWGDRLSGVKVCQQPLPPPFLHSHTRMRTLPTCTLSVCAPCTVHAPPPPRTLLHHYCTRGMLCAIVVGI